MTIMIMINEYVVYGSIVGRGGSSSSITDGGGRGGGLKLDKGILHCSTGSEKPAAGGI